MTRSLVELAKASPEWERAQLLTLEGHSLSVINATVSEHEFDSHDGPELLICLKGLYAIETPTGVISIPEGHSFTVPSGMKHRPANQQACVILVAR